MRLRIAVSARFSGTTEIEVPDEDIERHGGADAYVERYADEWARRCVEEGDPIDPDIDDLQVWNESTRRWETVPENPESMR